MGFAQMTATTMEQLLRRSAEAVLERQSPEQLPADVRSFLNALRYHPVDDGTMEPETEAAHRAKLLHAAAGFTRLFQLHARDAPGLVFLGAETDPSGIVPGGVNQRGLPASGVGLSFRAAFEGCVGEGVELLSQYQSAADDLFWSALADHAAVPGRVTGTVAAGLQAAGLPGDTAIEWVTARGVLDGKEAVFPADICLRRGSKQIAVPPWPLSIGCAAGKTFESAALHGLLELIERDAAALWWRGGVRGRSIPLDSEAARRAVELLAAVRGSSQRRRSWLLDITTDLGIPSVAAVSVDQEGNGFACGVATRLSLARASEAAILEMCQMELAHDVVAAKRRESGDDALNAHDRAHLRRGSELSLQDCALLHPVPPVGQTLDIPDVDEASSLRWLVEHLDRVGIKTFSLDLSRTPFGIPVARMLCSGLEREPSEVVGDRLRGAIQSTGGGLAYTRGIPLM
jgi:ribosomal protein S12 methylthiotransferase accessory factor